MLLAAQVALVLVQVGRELREFQDLEFRLARTSRPCAVAVAVGAAGARDPLAHVLLGAVVDLGENKSARTTGLVSLSKMNKNTS